MRKIVTVILSISVTAILFGCGITDKIEEKASEAITEKVLEESAGGDVDVDIDGDTYTIDGENGEKIEIGTSEWPSDDFFKEIPKFDSGTIASSIASETGTMIVINEADAEKFSAYYDEIKSAFPLKPAEGKTEGLVTYTGTNEAGITISISFTTEDGSVLITASKAVQ